MPTNYLLPLLLLAISLPLAAQYAPRANYGAKSELTDQVIHIAGQSDELSLAQYAAALPPGQFPMGYMAYIPARADAARRDRTRRNLGDIVRYYPNDMVFQLGLSMTSGGNGYTADVAAGVYDANIDAIAAMLDSLNRDIFVRVGYEANGFWNGYDASSYVPAFRRVVDRLRAASDRFTIVWCTHPITSLSDMLTYYPGDEYVDWWSIDLFQPNFIRSGNTTAFLNAAAEREKPVLIGEATPTEVGVGNGRQSWDTWYEPFFNIIRDNPGVKGFSYINRDWRYISSLSSWGNANIQTDAVVLDLYRQEMSNDIYAHLPQTTGHRTAMVLADAELRLSSGGAASTDDQEFQVGISGTDTLLTYVRFDLDTLLDDSIRAVKFWVAGRGSAAQDREIEVVQVEDWGATTPTYATRPAVVGSLGVSDINDNGRNKLVTIELTDAVRRAHDAGNRTIALGFRLTAESAPLNTFQSSRRADGYPPQLQVVYDEKTLSVSTTPPGAVAASLSIFPNPTADTFRLDVDSDRYEARVFDVQGRLLAVRRGLSRSVRMDASAWPVGTYLVEVVCADGRRGSARLVRVGH